jgi:hypothetical protein
MVMVVMHHVRTVVGRACTRGEFEHFAPKDTDRTEC